MPAAEEIDQFRGNQGTRDQSFGRIALDADYSVRLREDGTFRCGFAAYDAGADLDLLRERNRAAGRAGLIANSGLALGLAAPVEVGEATAALALHLRAQRIVTIELARIRDHRLARLREQAMLDLIEDRRRTLRHGCHRQLGL